MNEKYIQALILGSIIGFAIIIDDYIAPQPNQKIMQKHLMVKDIKKSPKWVEDTGKEINLHEIDDHEIIVLKTDNKKVNSDEIKKIFKFKIDGNDSNEKEAKKDIRINISSNDMSNIDIQSIFEEIQMQLTDEELSELKSKLEDARFELENALAEEQLDNVGIDVQVEVKND